jgi:hypothetical protein
MFQLLGSAGVDWTLTCAGGRHEEHRRKATLCRVLWKLASSGLTANIVSRIGGTDSLAQLHSGKAYIGGGLGSDFGHQTRLGGKFLLGFEIERSRCGYAASGRELSGRIISLRLECKVLFMSGDTADAVISHGVLEAEYAFLQKPFTPSALARKVRNVLDGVS